MVLSASPVGYRAAMRLLQICAVAMLAGCPSTLTLLTAAEATAPAAPSVPAANVVLIDKALNITGATVTGTQTKLELAQKSALLPFAGASVKAKVDEAQVQAEAAKGLHTDLTNLRAGKKVDPKGILAGFAAGKPAASSDRLKDIPGAAKISSFLATPGLAQALVSNLPVDKIPGYSAALAALTK